MPFYGILAFEINWKKKPLNLKMLHVAHFLRVLELSGTRGVNSPLTIPLVSKTSSSHHCNNKNQPRKQSMWSQV